MTVGVADLRQVFDLWIGQLGLEIVVRREGPDPGLGRLWGIPAERIVDQVLIRMPGAWIGQLHFIQFSDPDAPVRAGAAATDLGPKNIDVNCIDMPARFSELAAAGVNFARRSVNMKWAAYARVKCKCPVTTTSTSS